MTWHDAIARRAINDWRDVYQLRAAALVNDAAVAALATFEQHIPEYGGLEAWRRPGSVAADYVRPILRAHLVEAASLLIDDALNALIRIDPRFGSLAAQGSELDLPDLPKRVVTPVPDRPAIEEPVAPPAALPTLLHDVFARGVAFAERATQATHELANAMVTQTRELIGVHTLLRNAAREEVRHYWIGPMTGDGRTYLAELDAVFDTLADRARALLIGQTE
jgi:hypothetical protein